MLETIMPYVLEVLGVALVTLLGVLGTWLSVKMSKRVELTTLNQAMQQCVDAAQITVGELNQTTVDQLKRANMDGKLTPDEIETLKRALIDKTKEKMSSAVINVLVGAGVDLQALITGAGECLINHLNGDR